MRYRSVTACALLPILSLGAAMSPLGCASLDDAALVESSESDVIRDVTRQLTGLYAVSNYQAFFLAPDGTYGTNGSGDIAGVLGEKGTWRASPLPGGRRRLVFEPTGSLPPAELELAPVLQPLTEDPAWTVRGPVLNGKRIEKVFLEAKVTSPRTSFQLQACKDASCLVHASFTYSLTNRGTKARRIRGSGGTYVWAELRDAQGNELAPAGIRFAATDAVVEVIAPGATYTEAFPVTFAGRDGKSLVSGTYHVEAKADLGLKASTSFEVETTGQLTSCAAGTLACATGCCPVPLPPADAKADGLVESLGRSCAFRRGGRVWCWGKDDTNVIRAPGLEAGFTAVEQLAGDGLNMCALQGGVVSCGAPFRSGRAVTGLPTTKLTQLADGYAVVDGAVWTWQANLVATPHPKFTSGVRAASFSGWGDCVLRAGRIECQELNADPEVLGGAPANIVSLWTGFDDLVVETASGQIWSVDQLDAGGRATKIDGVVGPLKSVASSMDATCAVTDTGKVYCWGDNSWGQLAQPESVHDSSVALEVGGLPGPTVSVAGGYGNVCALSESGLVSCWGNGALGGGFGRPGGIERTPISLAPWW